MKGPLISVVIPTKDRPDLLARCLRAVVGQECEAAFEVVVVNDAGCPVDDVARRYDRVTVVTGAGRGPAAARNEGIAHASGEVVLFTDDDAIPRPGWMKAALTALADRPDAVGVVGRVESPPFDPLYEHSVRNDGGVGNFLTCNVAYRKAALERVGGFDTGFPYPAAEDRDLGYRMQGIGLVLFEPAMVVTHPPRRVRPRDVTRRGRFVESEWRLHRKHPQTRPPRWSVRWGPVIRLARGWQRLASDPEVIQGSPRRAVRLAALATGQTLVALAVTLRGDRPQPLSPVGAEGPSPTPPLRLAWIGPEPQPGGGAAGCAWLIVQGLAELGCQIDCYLGGAHEQLPRELSSVPGVRVVNYDTGWRYDRWYSNHRITKVLTGFASRAWGRRRLGSFVVQQHRLHPYDVIYQFSTIEVFGLRPHLGELPPLVMHPSTHMAGELRWVRAERHLAARCEPWWRRRAVEALLTYRARRQRRDIQLATRVAAISRRFGEHLVHDYGVAPRRVDVVPNPIDLDEMRPVDRAEHAGPWRVVFVSRISARKGVELIVELSHRLADLEGTVTLELVGAETLWSDYRPLLADLDPRIATYQGHLGRTDLIQLLGEVDLLVQPAKYEPFGLTVGEALACGVPVVATDEVGAAEGVDPECCLVVPAGDVDALEKAVRSMLDRLGSGDGPAMRRRARAEAERLFAPERVAQLAFDTLALAAGRPTGGAA